MQFKTYVLVFLVLTALATEAQVAFMRFTRVKGTVLCSIDGNVTATSAPGFPFASVELKCTLGDLEYESLTNAAGLFTIVSLLTTTFPTSFFISNCHLIVSTRLSKCNSTLPSQGGLISSLSYIGDTSEKPWNFNFTDFVPSGFHYVPDTGSILLKS